MSALLTLLRRVSQSLDRGMATAEYAIGTVAACGFGAVLYKVVTSPATSQAISGLIRKALNLAF